MLVTTTNDVTGYRVARYLGLVRGITVRSRSLIGASQGFDPTGRLDVAIRRLALLDPLEGRLHRGPYRAGGNSTRVGAKGRRRNRYRPEWRRGARDGRRGCRSGLSARAIDGERR